MSVLVTGAAGFIGFHVARRLVERGDDVVGVDNVNDYYGTELKHRRLAELSGAANFTFHEVDLAKEGALAGALASKKPRLVIHLAAQANVRYALQNPHAYVQSNLAGHVNVLEFCRYADGLDRLIYASSSSVYGAHNKVPFSENDATDQPASLYAATKKTDEMISAIYGRLFGLTQIGLRFFSVYGPWGRPDMAYWLFTDAILQGRPIKVFNHGNMQRDFTYIDDVVAGVLAIADGPEPEGGARPVYNIGNSRPVVLLDMIQTLERILGVPAKMEMLPMQGGEIPVTYADVSAIRADYGYEPRTGLEEGLRRFVEWFRAYHRVS